MLITCWFLCGVSSKHGDLYIPIEYWIDRDFGDEDNG